MSSLVGRFSADYHKDDYRTASRLALRALDAGKVVWWSADTEECAAYYGLTLERVSARGAQLVFSRLPSSKDLAQWPVPDVVFQSKPDVHDPDGLLQRYLEKFQYRPTRRLPAFSIWTRQGAGLEPLVTEKAETQQPASPVLR